jgi:MerR family transcriptional regulator, copper efflux regulator
MDKSPAVPSAARIGALSARTGCSVPTIRYYEEVGLIPAAARSPSGHRVYDDATAQLVGFIRRCRDFGFSLEQVRVLLSLARGGRDCAEARDIAAQHLRGVRARLLELMTLERGLARFVEVCNSSCVGGPATECNILRDLGLDGQAAGKGCC